MKSRNLKVALANLFASMLLFITTPFADARTYALLVGCDDYPGTSFDLPVVHIDITNMVTVLVDIYGIPESNIVASVDTVTNGVTMRDAIRTLLAHQDATMFVIYYTGHGSAIGTNSVMNLSGGTFSDMNLNDALTNNTVQTFVIVDLCEGGGFAANCSNDHTVVISASSITEGAGYGSYGSDFTCMLADSFAWHNDQYDNWINVFFDWNLIGEGVMPDTADDNLDGNVTMAEAFDRADECMFLFGIWKPGYDSDPQIGGQNRDLFLDQKYDFTPPDILAVQHGSERTSNIYIQFSERMDVASLNEDNIFISGSSSGEHACEFYFDYETCTLTVNPNTDFSYLETVTVTLLTGVLDLFGNALCYPYQFQYFIENEPGKISSDTDADGMPDAYELTIGFDPFDPEDAALDSDGDGFSTVQEYHCGTHPFNSMDALLITCIEETAAGINLSFPTVLGKMYRLERNDNFPSGPWNIAVINIPGTGGMVQVLDNSAVALLSIYRVIVLY